MSPLHPLFHAIAIAPTEQSFGPTPAFKAQDLANLGAVCLHLSARLAELRRQFPSIAKSPGQSLTPREIQIVNLVAKGLTNAEIGSELWITQNSVKQALKRIFRKLHVSSRVEMVMKVKDMLQM